MKYPSVILILFSLLCTQHIKAQSAGDNYEIATWQGFGEAAVSYTFDDNYGNQLDVMVPMFNEYGYQLTLFTFTNAFISANYEGLSEAAAQGHEIGSHTVTHRNLSDLSDEEQIEELANSKATLEDNISGYSVHTIAYPFCVPGNNDITSQYYIAARGCSGQIVSNDPSNAMNISSMVIGTEGHETTEDFNNRVNAAARTKGWVVFLGHGSDGEGGYSEVSSREIKGNLDYMAEGDTRFWVSSFGNVFKYSQERESASFTELSASESQIELELTDELDNEVYDVALTVRRELPQDWDSASVSQNEESLDARIVTLDGSRFVEFNAVPDQGTITIENQVATSNELIDKADSFNLIQNYPNPFNPSTKISFHLPVNSEVSLRVFDTLGREVATLIDNRKGPGLHNVHFDASHLSSGLYIYQLNAGDFMETRKMMLVK
ncbi:polysaccharide deacetylase family protein [Gracilimonas mengyeensis]|uniref:Por secretion system C-terminal sorting domain-containing protein n=1 Tax=Gracilimonas mengyeensis TaxID=1302730 RepID=A0A521D4D2_9BACT|nr:polysaccharide deacetylase family protein [Gracilimonas mengyeensis]SMO66515.1 Por secretion system C-terminal sorting domain-containing protein [Gracilimonas mengyeensis]